MTEYKEGQPFSERYAWWAEQEINHENQNISDYANLIVEEYQKLINQEITIEQFESNTPEINEDTPLNYIRNRIIGWYPN